MLQKYLRRDLSMADEKTTGNRKNKANKITEVERDHAYRK